MSYLAADDRPVTLARLGQMRSEGQKIAMLTCYDASFAAVLDGAGVDVLLVGDSLGNVIQGQKTTLPVTVSQMAYHTECVVRGVRRAFVVADLPFASYASPAQALESAATLMRAGAQMVKLEGGLWLAETIRALVERGIPVCAHIGLTPQSVHQLGGYRVQGRDEAGAETLLREAAACEAAGAGLIVLEMVPATLAGRVTVQTRTAATIGIGAGSACHGQVLVLYDMLGVFPGKKARFVKNFLEGRDSIQAACAAYVEAVKQGSFPAPEHSY